MNCRNRMAAAAAAALTLSFFAAPAQASAPQHGPITITSDNGFTDCACVTSGTGKASNPFIIGPWAITAPSAGGWGVKVDNSSGAITKFFSITGLSANYNDTNPAHPFVWLVGVTNASTISSLSANNDGTGVRLDSSSNTTLDNLSFNLMNGNSVLLNSSSFVSITNSKLKSAGPPQSDMGDQNGFKAVDSSHLTIVSPSNCATTLTCNSFTYDDAMACGCRTPTR